MNFKATAIKVIIYTLLLISFYILYMADVLNQYKSFFLKAHNFCYTKNLTYFGFGGIKMFKCYALRKITCAGVKKQTLQNPKRLLKKKEYI